MNNWIQSPDETCKIYIHTYTHKGESGETSYTFLSQRLFFYFLNFQFIDILIKIGLSFDLTIISYLHMIF